MHFSHLGPFFLWKFVKFKIFQFFLMVFLSFEISFSQNNLVSNLNDYTFPHFLAILGHFGHFLGWIAGQVLEEKPSTMKSFERNLSKTTRKCSKVPMCSSARPKNSNFEPFLKVNIYTPPPPRPIRPIIVEIKNYQLQGGEKRGFPWKYHNFLATKKATVCSK